MQTDGRFIGSKPLMFAMDEITGWDLDYEWQMDVARFLKIKNMFTKNILDLGQIFESL